MTNIELCDKRVELLNLETVKSPSFFSNVVIMVNLGQLLSKVPHSRHLFVLEVLSFSKENWLAE